LTTVDVLIVGGGPCRVRVAQSYRESAGEASVSLLAREPYLPYHRPALTKRVLRGEQEAVDTLVLERDRSARPSGTRRNLPDGRAVIRYFEGDRLRAALLTGQTKDEEAELETRIRTDALAANAR